MSLDREASAQSLAIPNLFLNQILILSSKIIIFGHENSDYRRRTGTSRNITALS